MLEKDMLKEDLKKLESAMTSLKLYSYSEPWEDCLMFQTYKAICDIIGVLMKLIGDDEVHEKEDCHSELDSSDEKTT